MNNNRIIDLQFLDGNDELYIVLYNEYIDRLYSYGRGLGFDKETLKDAIHDVFLNLLTKRNSIGKVRNMRAFLFKSLYNRLIDIKRKETDNQEVQDTTMNFHINVSVLDNMIDAEQSHRLRETLERLLNGLSHMQRSAIYFRFMCEMEYSEIADILGVTQHAARKFVSKGIHNIRNKKEMLFYWQEKNFIAQQKTPPYN